MLSSARLPKSWLKKMPTLPPSIIHSRTKFEVPLVDDTPIVLLFSLRFKAVFFALLSVLSGAKLTPTPKPSMSPF